jgi:hypothetical protein
VGLGRCEIGQDRQLTDDVWARLDPGAGRLSRRQAGRTVLAALVVATLTGAFAVAWHGWVEPRLRLVNLHATGVSAGRLATRQMEYTYSLEIANRGPAVTILAMGADAPGLVLLAARPMAVTEVDSVTGWHALPWPLTMDRGQVVHVDLVYRTTDCARIGHAGALPVTLDRWWGRQHAQVDTGDFPDWLGDFAEQACRA